MRKEDQEHDIDESGSSQREPASVAHDSGVPRGSIPPPTQEELEIDAGWGGVPKPVAAKPVAAKPAVSKPAVAKPAVAKPAVSKPAVTKPKEAPASGADLATQLFEQVFGKKESKDGAAPPRRTSEPRVEAKPISRSEAKPISRVEAKPIARSAAKPAPQRKERKPPKVRQKRAAPEKRAARRARKAEEKAARAAERQAEFQAANRAAQNAAKLAEQRRLERQHQAGEPGNRHAGEARDSDPDLVEDELAGDRVPTRKARRAKAASKRRDKPPRELDIPLEKMRPSEEDTSTRAFERLPFKWLVAALVVAGGVVFLAMKL